MCRDERYVLLKMNVAPLLELSRKFWMIWNGHSRRKVTRLTMMFKMISGLRAIQPGRYILFKRRRGTGQFHPEKFIQVSAKTNKCQHSFIARTIRDWNCLPNCVIESSQWRFSKWPSCASFKTMNPEHFIIIIIHVTLAPWLYVKISTSTFAHLPWWDIPFADNAIRIRIRMCCGVPGWQMLWVNDQVSKIYFCVRGTRTQPLIFVGCSVHYWVSCAIKVAEHSFGSLYMLFAKSWQEKGCSSQAETWQVKNTLMKDFDWQVKCDVFVVSMATWTIEYNRKISLLLSLHKVRSLNFSINLHTAYHN